MRRQYFAFFRLEPAKMEDRLKHINGRITLGDPRKDGVPAWDVPGAICVTLPSDKDMTYHTMIIGSTGRGKSVFIDELEELARAKGCKLHILEAEAATRPIKPKELLPPVKVDEYLTLSGELFRDASGCIHDILGCYMTQEAVARFLSESRIGAQILWYNEVETTIGDDMTGALEEFLTGDDSWIDHRADYNTRCILMRAAARARGYLVEDDKPA
jgi:hypothetical protein